jgi:succinate dehydrogenase/fumarate reductase flavoprotein subunit
MHGYDVLVLGTGAAGLTAALTAAEEGARVGLFEKGETVGGTTAYSGGMIWIPANPHEPAAKGDSRELALTYLKALSSGLISDEMAETYVDAGSEMVSYLEERTPVQFYCVADFPDYHPEQAGAMAAGGRTLECPLYPFGELGEWKDRVHVSPYWPTYHITVGETTLGQPVADEITPEEFGRRAENDERGMGLALAGRLLRACLDRGVEPQAGYRAVELIMEDGAVAGVVFETVAGRKEVRAPNVVIATGGFERDPQLNRAFLRGPCTHAVSVPTNTGDGLRMAMRIGAMLGNMREAWWMPVVDIPGSNDAGQMLLTVERTQPGTIMVNKAGKRFTNEAANYNAFGAAFHEQDTTLGVYKNLPCWMIFNRAWYKTYGLAGGLADPASLPDDPPEWAIRGDTLAELADKLGIPADALEETVARFNANARALRDPDFHRGESVFDRWWGDPTRRDGTAAPTLGPLEGGPYYAVEVHSGALGTKGGPQTDTRARVLDVDGDVITGLYAAGNAMASPMGMTYGGAGGTLGPAMVFGYLAGRDIGERVAATSDTELSAAQA